VFCATGKCNIKMCYTVVVAVTLLVSSSSGDADDVDELVVDSSFMVSVVVPHDFVFSITTLSVATIKR
jgi:hypothetical protein